MAEKKNGIDKPKIKALEKLKENGFDTANKIKMLEARQMLKLGMATEMQEIFDLQDAIKANHGEIAWLLGGEDPKPVKKEAVRDADDDRRPEAESRRAFGFSNPVS